jgi:hypothetical protein
MTGLRLAAEEMGLQMAVKPAGFILSTTTNPYLRAEISIVRSCATGRVRSSCERLRCFGGIDSKLRRRVFGVRGNAVLDMVVLGSLNAQACPSTILLWQVLVAIKTRSFLPLFHRSHLPIRSFFEWRIAALQMAEKDG